MVLWDRLDVELRVQRDVDAAVCWHCGGVMAKWRIVGGQRRLEGAGAFCISPSLWALVGVLGRWKLFEELRESTQPAV